VNFGPCQLDRVAEQECVALVARELAAGRGGWIVTANVDILRRMAVDTDFATLCSRASLVIADGMPLVWASRLRGEPLPERVTGSSLVWTLSAMAAAQGQSVYLLGGSPTTAERTATALLRSNPLLRVAGTSCPETGFEARPDAVSAIARAVVAARPDIVYVALGTPKTERLIATIRHQLPQAWWIGVGISFSFASGEIPRAPVWMQRAGLEWLHRVAQEPARLSRRYFLDDAPFAARVLASAAWSGLRRRRKSRPSWAGEVR
jgi:N-acetylglucosaminyldiphosphoundecaprenol N-acetyl-beta-D-mannosaminyltransferase